MKETPNASFVDYLTVLMKRRRLIIKTFSISVLCAIIISLIIPPQYTATATILPPNLQQEALLGMLQGSIISTLGGMSGLGSMLPGATTPSDLFAAILESGRISDNIITKYNLKKIFKTRTMDDTYKMLKGITRIRVTPEGIISVSVTWYDKYLATNIANSFIEELDRFNTETAMTTGKKYRIFIEKRLNENLDSLKQAENNLRKFQEEHRTIALDIELQSVIEAIAELKGQIILLEAQKAAVGSPSGTSNLYATNIDRQLRELKKQLAKIEFGDTLQKRKEFGAGFAVPFSQLPEVALEYAGLIRDVKVQETIYELLTQQYEQAKIMELKDTPTVQILDKASPPEKKSTPKRTQIVLLVAFFSIIISIIVSYWLESFEKIKQRTGEYNKWLNIYDKLNKDYNSTKLRVRNFFRKRKRNKGSNL